MKTQTLEILQALDAVLSSGNSAYLITILETWGASPRPAGSLLCFDPVSNKVYGSVSGGCIEMDLLSDLNDCPGVADFPCIRKYGADSKGSGLPCGASISLLIEYLHPQDRALVFGKKADTRDQIGFLVERLEQGKACQRHVRLERPGDNKQVVTRLDNLADSNSNRWSERRTPLMLSDTEISQIFDAPKRMLIVGAGDVSDALIPLARQLGYHVSLIDPRKEVLDRRALPQADEVITDKLPDDLIAECFIDQACAIVALAHDPRLDDLAIIAALQGKAHFVGALGSERTTANRMNRLASLGLTDHQLRRLKAPIGLDIGSRTPIEIAISISAQLIRTGHYESNFNAAKENLRCEALNS